MLTSDDYLKTWRWILVDGMGWLPEQFSVWLERTQLAELLDDPQSMIYHDPPEVIVADALIPPSLKPSRQGLRLCRLRRDLKSHLSENVGPTTDWAFFRKRVDEILAAS